MELSTSILRAIMPSCSAARATLFLPLLAAAMEEFGISTRLRQAAFLAQAGHESGALGRLVENLNYSAAGLLSTWPSRFTAESAAAYARQPERIANRVYGGRGGNGDEGSGDGWRFRGRGVFQLTFRDNYSRAGQALGLPLEDEPELVATPPVACRTAGRYWRDQDLNSPADSGDMETVTRRINGGLTGLADRLAYYVRAKAALGL